ncbi:MAG: radical SAM protein [Planctomycetes bacterium]|nr:radical SAM protein [Planctomycetota bacterium]
MNASHGIAGLRWVVFQLLEACNLRCRMCYEWGETGTYKKLPDLNVLDIEILCSVVEQCREARPYYEFFGGEPLLYPHLERAIRCIRERGSDVGIPTNGILLEEQAEMLVSAQPTTLWVSLDGPRELNDHQRGKGSFERVQRGLEAVRRQREKSGTAQPRLGILTTVTASNHTSLEELFFQSLKLEELDCVGIVFQNFSTLEEHEAYARELRVEFGIPSAPCARGYVRDPALFASMDFTALARQVERIAKACSDRGIAFYVHPKTIDAESYRHYFAARRREIADFKSRCAFPWIYLEVAASGETTPCHTFYDLSVGHAGRQSIEEIWRGDALQRLRARLRRGLMPNCAACCRYYNNTTSITEAWSR